MLKGYRWRIGDGKQMNIFSSCWIPRLSTFKPITPPNLPGNTCVAELIDENNCWKKDKIYQHFGKDDADCIVHIPLSRRQSEDTIIWHYDKRGQYLVKSGYQVAVNHKHQGIPNCSNLNPSHWSVIWKLKIPEKVKIFLWRAAKDILPTAENLWRKRVLQEATCLVCTHQLENSAHALLDCKIARKVWRVSPIGSVVQEEKFPDVITLLLSLQRQQNDISGKIVAFLLWTIWNARNNMLFNGRHEDPVRLVARAAAVADSIKRIQQPEANFLAVPTLMQQNKWSLPEEGWLKINVDAAIDGENRLAGLWAAIRNHKGELVGATVNTVKSLGDVEMNEARVVLWGMQAAFKAGAISIVLESDSKGVIELINNKRGSLT